MVASFFQKPIGAVTLLGTAIGAPYAIFETDAGTTARVAIQNWVSTTPPSEASPPGSDGASATPPSNSTPWTASLSPNITTDPNFSSASYPAGTVVTPVGPPMLYQNAPGIGPGTPSAHTLPWQSTNLSAYPTSLNAPTANTHNPNSPTYSPAAGYAPLTGSMASSPPTTLYAPTLSGPPNAVPNQTASPMASPSFPGANPMALSSQFPASAWPTNAAPSPSSMAYSSAMPVSTASPYQPASPYPPAPLNTYASPSTPSGYVSDFREVLRFDVSPAFVTQRFDRITTVLSNVHLDGMRVAFVSGTRPSDIAGTLTYFFDLQQTVQRIQFQGSTGDPSVLSQLMVQYYRLSPENSLGGHFFTTRWNGQVTSLMLISHAPVITADAPNNRYSIFLELNQPSHQYALSQEANQILLQTQARQR